MLDTKAEQQKPIEKRVAYLVTHQKYRIAVGHAPNLAAGEKLLRRWRSILFLNLSSDALDGWIVHRLVQGTPEISPTTGGHHPHDRKRSPSTLAAEIVPFETTVVVFDECLTCYFSCVHLEFHLFSIPPVEKWLT